MEGKILKSGDGFILRYRSPDINELRRLANWLRNTMNIDFIDYGPGY